MRKNDIRLSQLAKMYSAIAEVPYEEALNIIRKTKTGQKIKDNDPILMYEQHTSNLMEIAKELPIDTRKKFTADKVIESFKNISIPRPEIKMPARSKHKVVFQQQLKKSQKVKLRVGRDTQKLIRKVNGSITSGK